MARLISLLSLALAMSCGATAAAQEAPMAGPFKLALKTPTGAYFLASPGRGAEPGSVEGWIWTITTEPTGEGPAEHDALAQHAVLRCDGKSIEILGSESYLLGRLVGISDEVRNPVTPRANTPMEMVWKTGCDWEIRFNAKSSYGLAEAYTVAKTP